MPAWICFLPSGAGQSGSGFWLLGRDCLDLRRNHPRGGGDGRGAPRNGIAQHVELWVQDSPFGSGRPSRAGSGFARGGFCPRRARTGVLGCHQPESPGSSWMGGPAPGDPTETPGSPGFLESRGAPHPGRQRFGRRRLAAFLHPSPDRPLLRLSGGTS